MKTDHAARKRTSRRAGNAWRDYGAPRHVECEADDVNSGKLALFPQAAKFKAEGVVQFP